MRKPGSSFVSLTAVGVMGAWLAGCPVWGENGDGSGMGTPYDAGVDTPVTPQNCLSNNDCVGGYCSSSRVCVTSQACTRAADCPSGYACDMRGVCVPGCTDAECSARGAGLVCDATARQCVPSGRCSANTDCTAPNVCLGGSCQPPTNQCQFDYQCSGTGQSCVDGQCVVGCTTANAATMCASGQVCTAGHCAYPTGSTCSPACGASQLCVSGACLTTCSTDATCGAGNFCDHGVCRVDTRPHPLCTRDSDCNAQSICYNGACRRTCPMPGVGADGACMRVDVQFNLCASDMMGHSLCTSSNEQHPQCARTADCAAGRQCVNALCQ